MAENKDEKIVIAFKVHFEQVVRDVLEASNRKILSMLWADDVVLLMPCEHENVTVHNNNSILKDILARMATRIPGLATTIGLGGKTENLQAARQSYLQAMKVLRFAELKMNWGPIYDYDQLGIYKLLFEIEPDKLATYYQQVVKDLEEYDTKHHMDMVNSLFVYFEENCNAAKTAKRLFVHRNTFDYRLKKIEEITGRCLDNPYDRLTLQLGVIVGKMPMNEVLADEPRG